MEGVLVKFENEKKQQALKTYERINLDCDVFFKIQIFSVLIFIRLTILLVLQYYYF